MNKITEFGVESRSIKDRRIGKADSARSIVFYALVSKPVLVLNSSTKPRPGNRNRGFFMAYPGSDPLDSGLYGAGCAEYLTDKLEPVLPAPPVKRDIHHPRKRNITQSTEAARVTASTA